jgi:hypothetical protein
VWNGTFARLHKNEVTRNYPRGGVGFEMCDGELETATLLVVGVAGKFMKWYAKRGQPGNVKITSYDDWVIWLLFWPMDCSLELSNRSLIFVKCLNLDIAGRIFCNERVGDRDMKLKDLLSCIIRIRCLPFFRRHSQCWTEKVLVKSVATAEMGVEVQPIT